LGRDGAAPNNSRWSRFVSELASGDTSDYRYRSVRDHALPMMRDVVNGLLVASQLDAIVYPTQSVKPERIDAMADALAADARNLANLTGFPDLSN